MRRPSLPRYAIVVAALWATALAASPAADAQLRPPPEDVITGRPPPLLQDTPGPESKRRLPCGIDGPGVDLDDGSSYPSGRRPLRAAMIFVDFSDAPAGPGFVPQEVFNRLVPPAQRTLRWLSYRRFRLDAKPHLRWVRMPKPLRSYDFATESAKYDPYTDYLTDALRAAARSFDLSKFKTVYVVAGPNSHAPQAMINRPGSDSIRAGRARVEHLVTLDGYGVESAPSVMVHETGHVLGLPDLYKVGAATAWFRFVGPWDFMSDSWQAGTMMSWTRRAVGWLGNRNFRCVGRRRRNVRLWWVHSRGKIKGAVVRISRRRAYVIEARVEPAGENCPDRGVLVYRWNGEVPTGEGPIRVIDAQPGEDACGPHTNALFKPRQGGRSRYRDRYVAVSVLGGAKNGLRVQVRHLVRPRRR